MLGILYKNNYYTIIYIITCIVFYFIVSAFVAGTNLNRKSIQQACKAHNSYFALEKFVKNVIYANKDLLPEAK